MERENLDDLLQKRLAGIASVHQVFAEKLQVLFPPIDAQ